MPISDYNFYIYALYALIASVIGSVFVVIYSFKAEKVAGISNILFRVYFIFGSFAWVFSVFRDAKIMAIDIKWSAIAYISVSALLLFSLFERFRRTREVIIVVLVHLVFIGYCLFISSKESLFTSFSVYGVLVYSLILIVTCRQAVESRNIGYAFIAFAAFVVVLFSILQILEVKLHHNFTAAYGISLIQSSVGFIMVGLGFMATLLFDRQIRLAGLALNDPLTGLLNRRGLHNMLSPLLSNISRNKRCLSVVAIDIDHFKSINDTYGHAGGDTVLKNVAKIIKLNFRGGDICSRYGGEEFVIILPETSSSEATSIAERTREKFEKNEIAYSSSIVRVTASFGVASRKGTIDIDELIKEADKALYRAKELGRNRVCILENEN